MAREQVEELASALGEISRPWVQAAMAKAAGPEGKGLILIDVDLTGQSLGPDAQTSGTAFSYMDGHGWLQIAPARVILDPNGSIRSVLAKGMALAGVCSLRQVDSRLHSHAALSRIGPAGSVDWTDVTLRPVSDGVFGLVGPAHRISVGRMAAEVAECSSVHSPNCILSE